MMKQAIVGVLFTVFSLCVAYGEKPDKAAKVATAEKHGDSGDTNRYRHSGRDLGNCTRSRR